ncbi:hypothetical protein C8F04DRAFT_230058 [Mycena alexandri]|uniref:Uncharacterized protein n=1 Tax=Mycena alexandri TaxID=1745969 RepID=A0AAD6WQ30_9AGAR|nr:hypothetical protein C8F04DRAFT_230058 [Mycena alexandri]
MSCVRNNPTKLLFLRRLALADLTLVPRHKSSSLCGEPHLTSVVLLLKNSYPGGHGLELEPISLRLPANSTVSRFNILTHHLRLILDSSPASILPKTAIKYISQTHRCATTGAIQNNCILSLDCELLMAISIFVNHWLVGQQESGQTKNVFTRSHAPSRTGLSPGLVISGEHSVLQWASTLSYTTAPPVVDIIYLVQWGRVPGIVWLA